MVESRNGHLKNIFTVTLNADEDLAVQILNQVNEINVVQTRDEAEGLQ